MEFGVEPFSNINDRGLNKKQPDQVCIWVDMNMWNCVWMSQSNTLIGRYHVENVRKAERNPSRNLP